MSVRPPLRVPPVAAAAAALILLQLIVRAVVAFGGYFYWDDLILVGRAGTGPLLSTSYLFTDHDGHVMPAAFLLGGTITRLAPLVWIWPAMSLIVLQLMASLALLRTLHIILGWRPVLLVALCFGLFTPLGLPGFAWWAAALNYLPMVAALAWVCGDAILLVRTGRRRYAVTATLAYLGGLLFFEKSAVIPFAAFSVAVLLYHVQGHGSALRTVWHRGRRLWTSMLILTGAWIVLYVAVVDQQRWNWDPSMTWDLLRRSVTHGIVPGLIGGPWVWHRWVPASPWAVPPVAAMALGWLALAVAISVSLMRKRARGGGVAGRRRLRDRLPSSDLSDAFLGVHRPGVGPDIAVPARSGGHACAAGRGRLLRSQPARVAVAEHISASSRSGVLHGRAVRRQQSAIHEDIPHQLAGQPDKVLPAECNSRSGGCAQDLIVAPTRSGSRPGDSAAGRRSAEPRKPHVRSNQRTARVRRLHRPTAHVHTVRPSGRRQRDMGADRSCRDPSRSAAISLNRIRPFGCRWTAPSCRPIGPPRSTTSPTPRARSTCPYR